MNALLWWLFPNLRRAWLPQFSRLGIQCPAPVYVCHMLYCCMCYPVCWGEVSGLASWLMCFTRFSIIFWPTDVFKPSRYYLGQFSAILLTFSASALLHVSCSIYWPLLISQK